MALPQIPIVVVPSVTKLPPETDGAVLVGGSHGGVYAAYLSVKAGARAAIHNDAGTGRDGAGIGGLAWAQRHGMAMAAVAAASARIGDGEDMMRRGAVSAANPLAVAAGVRPGMACAAAAELLKAAPWPHLAPAPLAETVAEIALVAGRPAVVCMDSISLIGPEHRGRIVAGGSHGGLPAGRTAAPVGAALALFNDAGFGIEDAGVAGLAELDAVGAAGAAVAAASARIGEGRSTLFDGRISALNRAAERLGARLGEPALDLARRLIDSPGR